MNRREFSAARRATKAQGEFLGLAARGFKAAVKLGARKILKKGPARSIATGVLAGVAARPAARATGKAAASVKEAVFGEKKKYRRINPGNAKALRRAIRRIKSAEKLFRQVLTVQGKKATGIKPKGRK